MSYNRYKKIINMYTLLLLTFFTCKHRDPKEKPTIAWVPGLPQLICLHFAKYTSLWADRVSVTGHRPTAVPSGCAGLVGWSAAWGTLRSTGQCSRPQEERIFRLGKEMSKLPLADNNYRQT